MATIDGYKAGDQVEWNGRGVVGWLPAVVVGKRHDGGIAYVDLVADGDIAVSEEDGDRIRRPS